MMITTLQNKKKYIIILVMIFSVSSDIWSQGCSPDITKPVIIQNPSYFVYANPLIGFQLNARDVGIQATDNCTASSLLRYAFSSNPLDTVIQLSAPLVTNLSKLIYVFDEAGNNMVTLADIIFRNCTDRLVCHNNPIIKLAKNTSYRVTLDELLETEPCLNQKYTVEWVDANNTRKPLDVIDANFPHDFRFYVTEPISKNACWSVITLITGSCLKENDFVFTPNNKTLQCTEFRSASEIGFPFSSAYFTNEVSVNKFAVYVENQCSATNVTFSDSVTVVDCSKAIVYRVYRHWFAITPNGTSIKHTQILEYDFNIDKSFPSIINFYFKCPNPSWKNGIPPPQFTGYPIDLNCNGNLFSVRYDDSNNLVRNSCEETNTITRIWTVTNNCNGEVLTKKQTIVVSCNLDNINPTPVCVASKTVTLPPSGFVIIAASEFNAGSYDNCGPVDFSFDSAGLVLKQTFDVSYINKTTTLKLYVRDRNNNIEYCNVSLFVRNFSNPGGKVQFLSGNILDYNLAPYPNTTANKFIYNLDNAGQKLSLDLCPANPSQRSNYNLCIDSTLVPSVGKLNILFPDSSNLFRVSVFDWVQVMQYINGIKQFNPYQRIAADVDCNNKIDITDMLFMRQRILGLRSNFTCSDFECYTSDPSNIQKLSDQVISNWPAYKIDFVPVHKGDVSGTRFNYTNTHVATRGDKEIKLNYEDFAMIAGSSYDIWIKPNQKYQIYAMQIGQMYDATKVEVIEINSSIYPLANTVDYAINNNDWRLLLLNQTASKFDIEGGFIKIRVKALVNTRVSEAMSFKNAAFPSLAVNNDLELVPISLVANTTTGVEAQISSAEILVSPNPFSGDLNIYFSGKDINLNKLTIQTIDGKEVYSTQYNGMKDWRISSDIFASPGIYIVVLHSDRTNYFKKIIRI